MNRNLKKSIWVLALGIACTGLSTPSLAAAVPAPQDQDQDRNQNRDRNDNEVEDKAYFQQGFRNTASAPKVPVTASAPKKQGRAIRFWRTRRT